MRVVQIHKPRGREKGACGITFGGTIAADRELDCERAQYPTSGDLLSTSTMTLVVDSGEETPRGVVLTIADLEAEHTTDTERKIKHGWFTI